MTVTIPDIMREIRNCFPAAVLDGPWTISGGVLSPAGGLPDSGWIALEGFDGLNGVHHLEEGRTLPGAPDGSWTGRVWLLAPPEDFLRLCRQIADWAQRQLDPSVLSESFGAYSRTSLTVSGRPLGWQEIFADALRPYRRMFTEVSI
ncbi:MAG: hypothetical protein ACI4O7_05520 [Aristaeellaceae bacterium]